MNEYMSPSLPNVTESGNARYHVAENLFTGEFKVFPADQKLDISWDILIPVSNLDDAAWWCEMFVSGEAAITRHQS